MPALPTNVVVYKRVAGSAPGAGAEVVMTVPVGKWWWLYAFYVVLVQGATQTPQPILFFDDGASVFLESIGSTAVQAASTTCAYSWAPGMVPTGQVGTGAGVHSNAVIPDGMLLPAGYRIRTVTLGIGANSAYGAPVIFVAELG